MERNISDDKIEVMKSYGWSKEIETSFFQFAEDIIGDRYKGKFFIKKNTSNNKYSWNYNFSSTKISPRKKYLCSCDIELKQSIIFSVRNKSSSSKNQSQIRR